MRCNVENGTRGWWEKERGKELYGVRSSACASSVHRRLVRHWAQHSFGFSGQFSKTQWRRREKSLRKGSRIKGPTHHQRVNDMRLIPVSPIKAVKEQFHAVISCGLCKEERVTWIWAFQRLIFMVVKFSCLSVLSLLSETELSRNDLLPKHVSRPPEWVCYYLIFSDFNGCIYVSVRIVH